MTTGHTDHMQRILFLLIPVLLLTGCTQSLTASSRKPATGDQTETSQLIQRLASQDSLTFELCRSEPGSTSCTGANPAITGKDYGVVPVEWTLSAVTLHDIQQTDTGFSARAKLVSHVNNVNPWCTGANFEVRADINRYVLTTVDSVLCNWLVYGNAQFKLSLSIDDIFAASDADPAAFAGFFEWHVTGTLNGASSGYYLATPTQDAS